MEKRAISLITDHWGPDYRHLLTEDNVLVLTCGLCTTEQGEGEMPHKTGPRAMWLSQLGFCQSRQETQTRL